MPFKVLKKIQRGRDERYNPAPDVTAGRKKRLADGTTEVRQEPAPKWDDYPDAPHEIADGVLSPKEIKDLTATGAIVAVDKKGHEIGDDGKAKK